MPSPPTGQVWRCFCGTSNVGNFCANCGGRMPAAKGAWQQPNAWKGKGKGKGKWAGGSYHQPPQPYHGAPGPAAPMGGFSSQQPAPPPAPAPPQQHAQPPAAPMAGASAAPAAPGGGGSRPRSQSRGREAYDRWQRRGA
eukprot:10603409-Prorocentrum_lima.AAC.1